MTRAEVEDALRSVVREVAPEVSLDDVGPAESICEALGLDSIDFLNLVSGLRQRLGIEIPERDYPELLTPRGCVDYVLRHQRPETGG